MSSCCMFLQCQCRLGKCHLNESNPIADLELPFGLSLFLPNCKLLHVYRCLVCFSCEELFFSTTAGGGGGVCGFCIFISNIWVHIISIIFSHMIFKLPAYFQHLLSILDFGNWDQGAELLAEHLLNSWITVILLSNSFFVLVFM